MHTAQVNSAPAVDTYRCTHTSVGAQGTAPRTVQSALASQQKAWSYQTNSPVYLQKGFWGRSQKTSSNSHVSVLEKKWQNHTRASVCLMFIILSLSLSRDKSRHLPRFISQCFF